MEEKVFILTCLKKVLRVAVSICLVVLAVSSTNAEVPSLVNYQGRLTDLDGSPLDTTVAITFFLYGDSSGGSALWSETHPDVVTTDGLFSVLLGSISAMSPDLFNGGTRYLAMQLGGGPESDPRMPIVSVGYAFRAVNADTAAYAFAAPADGTGGWADAGSVVHLAESGDSVGIGTATPSAKLDVNGDVAIAGKATIGPANTNTGMDGFVAGKSNTVSQYSGSVSGGDHNTASGEYSHISGGQNNSASGNGATIGGGSADTASNSFATVAGGTGNVAAGTLATVGGGQNNRAASYATTVGGGSSNTAQQFNSTIAGGEGNTTIAIYSFIGGGLDNYAYGSNSTIGGGLADTIINTGNYGFIGGGESNMMWGHHGVIAGGAHNFQGGDYSAILGGFADTIHATADYSYLFGIGSRLDDDSTFMVDMPHIVFGDQSGGYEFPDTRGSDGQILVTDGGGKLSWADQATPPISPWTIDGGDVVLSDTSRHVSIGDTTYNTDWAKLSVETEGININSALRVRNKIGTAARFYSGGPGTLYSDLPAAVYGVGEGSSKGGYFVAWDGSGDALYASTNGSGYSGNFSGGRGVRINGNLQVFDTTQLSNVMISGKLTAGMNPVNTGTNATVPGGYYNEAVGDYSFAAGYRAKANHRGSFVWSDYRFSNFFSTAENQFLIRAENGVGIGLTSPQGILDISYNADGIGLHITNADRDIVWPAGQSLQLGDWDGATFNPRMEINSDGGVGIGLSSPKGQLDITDNSDGIALHISNADRDIAWQTGQSLQLGDWDGVTFNPRMRINNDGNVGVNTTAPDGALHVRGNADGMALHLSAASGDISWPTNNTLNLGTWDGVTFTERVRITAGGNVGIGVTSTPNILTVQQYSATDPIADSWGTYSSRRWKENIRPLEGALDLVLRLRGVSYDWKETGEHDIGLIAEEVGEVVPEVVHYEENGIDAQSVDYARLVAVLIEAVKEQERTIQQQSKSIEDLKSRMTAMQQAMEKSGLDASVASKEK